MWRACGWMALLVCAAFGAEPLPVPPASVPTSHASEKTFEVEGPEEALRISFDDLKLRQLLGHAEVPLDVEDRLPAWLKNLNGKSVRITGWMFPPPTDTKLPAFLLVSDGMWMNFGRSIDVNEKIGVRMRQGVTTDCIQGRPFDVVGQFKINSRVTVGKRGFLYLIVDAVLPGFDASTE